MWVPVIPQVGGIPFTLFEKKARERKKERESKGRKQQLQRATPRKTRKGQKEDRKEGRQSFVPGDMGAVQATQGTTPMHSKASGKRTHLAATVRHSAT